MEAPHNAGSESVTTVLTGIGLFLSGIGALLWRYFGPRKERRTLHEEGDEEAPPVERRRAEDAMRLRVERLELQMMGIHTQIDTRANGLQTALDAVETDFRRELSEERRQREVSEQHAERRNQEIFNRLDTANRGIGRIEGALDALLNSRGLKS